MSYGRPEGHPGPQIATGARMDVVRAVRRTCTSEPAGTATAASPRALCVVAASSNRADLRHGRRSALNQCLVPLIAVYHHEIGCLWPARPESTALTVTQIGPIRRRRDHGAPARRGRGGRAGRFRSARSAHGSYYVRTSSGRDLRTQVPLRPAVAQVSNRPDFLPFFSRNANARFRKRKFRIFDRAAQ